MTDRKTITPVDVHRQMSRWAATLAERCVVPTEAEPQYVEPSGIMVSEHNRRLVAAFDRYAYRPTPITRDPQWDALGGMLPWATVVPVPPPAELPRGLYAETTAPAADCVKEGPMEWTMEKIVEALKESAWYVRFCAWREAHGVHTHHDAAVAYWVSRYPKGNGMDMEESFRPLHSELVALLSDIRTGSIYGSGERCAVCGDPSPLGGEHDPGVEVNGTSWNDPDHVRRWFGAHDECYGVICASEGAGGLYAAAAILRARRLLGERKAEAVNHDPPHACGDCGHMECATHSAKGIYGRSCWVESKPVPPAKPALTPRERWESNGERWKMEGHPAPYWCTETGIREAAAFMTREELVRECEAVGSDLTETARKRGIALPPWSDPYAAQRERESDAGFSIRMGVANEKHHQARVLPRLEAYRAKEAVAARRRRVLLGLERGPDPRIILAGDLLDPSNRR